MLVSEEFTGLAAIASLDVVALGAVFDTLEPLRMVALGKVFSNGVAPDEPLEVAEYKI